MFDDLKLPDWVPTEERHIRVMAGIELVARKLPGKNWFVKTVPCNLCGKCCMDLPPNSGEGRTATPTEGFPPTDETGRCKYLIMEPDGIIYRCSLGLNRPMGCTFAETSHREYCCEEWIEIK